MPDTYFFSSAAVAAPHALAAETGRAILAEGGNAVEAMVAMAATIAVVYPHMNGIGGDGFWLIREPGGRVRAIDACGAASSLATIERYQTKGYDSIPPRGIDAALTVAGAIGGWAAALDYAASRGGRLPLETLLADAIRHGREGYPVSRSEGRYILKEFEALHRAPGFASFFLMDGKQPEAGTIRRAPKLADTLAHLADVGLDDFYRGDVGREIAADFERLGGIITRRDLETCRPGAREPLQARAADAALYNFPPPTQGLTSLLILGIFEHLKIRQGETVDHHHALIEATKRAIDIRNRVITCPSRLRHDPQAFLTPEVFAREAAAVDMNRAAPFPPAPPAEGDTIWMGAIDRDGLAVSYIQSLLWEFGSGVLLDGTGILWHNRGLGFSLDPKNRNALEPGRKPFHTLNPPIAALDDGRVVSYGCMGGDGQPQFQAQIYTRYRFGMGVAEAVDAPRWLLGRAWGASRVTLKVESRFDPAILDGLARRGHDIEEIGRPYADSLGHAGMLVKHPRDGRIEATHDPRADGGAAGL